MKHSIQAVLPWIDEQACRILLPIKRYSAISNKGESGIVHWWTFISCPRTVEYARNAMEERERGSRKKMKQTSLSGIASQLRTPTRIYLYACEHSKLDSRPCPSRITRRCPRTARAGDRGYIKHDEVALFFDARSGTIGFLPAMPITSRVNTIISINMHIRYKYVHIIFRARMTSEWAKDEA